MVCAFASVSGEEILLIGILVICGLNMANIAYQCIEIKYVAEEIRDYLAKK